MNQLRPLLNQLEAALKQEPAEEARNELLNALVAVQIGLHMFRVGAATPKELAEKLGTGRLGHWIEGYFAVLNVCMIVILGGAIGFFYVFDFEKLPEVSAPSNEPGAALERFHNDIFETDGKKPIIMVAGSGGGSRAALFTESVLRGLREKNKHTHIKLGSGVSGGSAALGYFALHHKKLVTDNDPTAWDEYHDAMARSYIDDVVSGIGEVRLLRGKVRVGRLLADSFAHHWTDHADGDDKRNSLNAAPIGLIFNTTLAGEKEKVKETWQMEHARNSGARLIITNVVDPQARFLSTVKHVILADGSIRLTQAAALSANFPPVFDNAFIDLPDKRQYWVTDGGASENQGLVSLLACLKQTLQAEADRRANQKEAKGDKNGKPLPAIRIVAADASALSVNFADDRGFQAMQYSCGLYAEELEGHLLKEVKTLYKELGASEDTIQLHRLRMPEVFRGRGGVATHWMLASRVAFVNPGDDKDTIVLPKKTVKKLIAHLHLDKAYDGADLETPQQKADFAKITLWLKEPDNRHRTAWDDLIKALD